MRTDLEPIIEQIKERLNITNLPDDYLEFITTVGFYQNLDTDFVIYGINLDDPSDLENYPSVVYSTESYFDYYELSDDEIVICDEIELEDTTTLYHEDLECEDEQDEPNDETIESSITTIIILNVSDGKVYYSDETDSTYREVAFESFTDFLNTVKQQETNLLNIDDDDDVLEN